MASPISSMHRGSHVVVDSISGEREEGASFEWWPLAQYKKTHGDPDKKGHSKMKRHGKDGVAIFERPVGVVKVTPFETTQAMRARGSGARQP